MYKRDIGKKDEFARSFQPSILKRGDRKKFLPLVPSADVRFLSARISLKRVLKK